MPPQQDDLLKSRSKGEDKIAVVHKRYPICATSMGWLFCKKIEKSTEVNKKLGLGVSLFTSNNSKA